MNHTAYAVTHNHSIVVSIESTNSHSISIQPSNRRRVDSVTNHYKAAFGVTHNHSIFVSIHTANSHSISIQPSNRT